jgi:hypothetical protein
MSALKGLTKENCAAGCNADGCVLLGDRQPRCCHPLKGGLAINQLNNPAARAAYDAACQAIGVGNYLKDETAA